MAQSACFVFGTALLPTHASSRAQPGLLTAQTLSRSCTALCRHQPVLPTPVSPALRPLPHAALESNQLGRPEPRANTVLRAVSGPGTEAASSAQISPEAEAVASSFVGLHHVGLLCQDLQKSLDFYQGLLGMEVNPARPDHKLPYDGKWLWAGTGMIHLMVLPNPDPLTGRPAHGGRDRHACIEVNSIEPLRAALDGAGIPYTTSQSGRPALFCRDPDGNALEFAVF